MGAPTRGARPPSQAAYYVALAGVVTLLLLLCCYFIYFCIKRVKELSSHESLMQGPVSSAKPSTSAYPVQPVARDSARAMAKLCAGVPGGGTVFPAATDPPSHHTAPQREHTEHLPLAEKPSPAPAIHHAAATTALTG